MNHHQKIHLKQMNDNHQHRHHHRIGHHRHHRQQLQGIEHL
jgi:hypothetical protein